MAIYRLIAAGHFGPEEIEDQSRVKETTMRKLSIALTAATALVVGVSLFEGSTQAAVVAGSNGILAGAETLNPMQNAQVYMWEGRRHCWYDNGWNGPGWYWCGYALRRGLGWGGGYGWHGWRGGHMGREFRREERREERHERREDRRY